jgi:hypothetical protein
MTPDPRQTKYQKMVEKVAAGPVAVSDIKDELKKGVFQGTGRTGFDEKGNKKPETNLASWFANMFAKQVEEKREETEGFHPTPEAAAESKK